MTAYYLTRKLADEALKDLEKLTGPDQCVKGVQDFIHKVREGLPHDRATAAEIHKEAQEAAEKGYADRGTVPGQ